MGFEGIANYISELDESNPGYTDPRSRGDDHLRSIKSAVKGQFTGLNSEVPGKAVTVRAAEINTLSGIDTADTIEHRFHSAGVCLDLHQKRIINTEWWVVQMYTAFCAEHPGSDFCVSPSTDSPYPGTPDCVPGYKDPLE